MSTPWSRPIPNPHTNLVDPSKVKSNLSDVPNFKKNTGVINGTTPSVTGVVAPTKVNTKSIINSLPTYLTVTH